MTKTLLCYGDSNTHGTPPMADLDAAGRFDAQTRWTGVAAQALGPGWTLIDEGQPGRTTVHDDPIAGPHRNGLRILPALLESHATLDGVVLMLGTNDLKARFSVTAHDIALSLGTLIEVVRRSGCGPGGGAPKVLLVAPPPIREVGCLAEMFQGGAAKSLSLGARIAAEAHRAGVAFVNAADHVAVSDLDGIHYDAGGHLTLGRALAQAMLGAFT